MATKFKVDELRAELAKRGLDTTGTKPTLVRRLEEAIQEVSNRQSTSSNGNNRKRQRDGSENEDTEKNKVKVTEELRSMTVKQLREEASRRGISTSGSKKELVERLSSFSDDGSDNGKLPDVVEVEEAKEEKLVTLTKKGASVLDQWLPDDIKANYHLLQCGDEIYDAMLNQTNVGQNNNKFYVIQALEFDGGGKFLVYNRWGRVGAKGGTQVFGPYTSQHDAIREFESKFHGKTKNHWSNRKDFVCYPGKYTWLEMDYSQNGEDSSVSGEPNSLMKNQPRETKLEGRIAKFISLICNVSMMKQQMMEIGYNADKLPLGKLSKSTISKGYDVLKRIADVINQSDRKILENLSSEFYTVIPHDFGYKKMREFTIDTPQKLKRKLEMVESLGLIELATKLLEDPTELQDDPLYYHYQQLHCQMTPVDVGTKEYLMVEKYMKNTHAKTHSSYNVDIVHIFRVARDGEEERFQKFSNTRNRMLLWHGSRLSNWIGILSQGLRIAPPEAPVTGYMFGKGVYFADMFSKSANYCYASPTAGDGVLLLCEVALGEMNELLTANYNADKLPKGKLSTKGVGATAPDFSKACTLEDGVVVPCGTPKEQPGIKGSLLYNEYIVYNVEQIRTRYVVQVKFNFGRHQS
ncbi:poly [ADP-ribose] polymerase 2 [Ipomoea triloba]|uniref:poly [ADP-ribose] polymerase 2 n=1 Tax=Ipomoea triloba TaxID=35885 RepID=UPI00125D54FA|nr:poly [ADP-ribose] polymerase 2 [Ipomoea triloba]